MLLNMEWEGQERRRKGIGNQMRTGQTLGSGAKALFSSARSIAGNESRLLAVRTV